MQCVAGGPPSQPPVVVRKVTIAAGIRPPARVSGPADLRPGEHLSARVYSVLRAIAASPARIPAGLAAATPVQQNLPCFLINAR